MSKSLSFRFDKIAKFNTCDYINLKNGRLVIIKIHIEDKLYIVSDGMNYTIRNYNGKFDKKTGQTELYDQIGGYYGKLNEALKALFKHKLHESNPKDIPETIEAIERIDNWLEKVVSGK